MPPRAFYPNCDMLLASGQEQATWHEQAAQARAEHFGRAVFVRGVVEVSSFCRENCAYCEMRRENAALERGRAAHERLAEEIIHRRPASVTDLHIEGGEDPVAAREVVLPLIAALKRETSLGISVGLGVLNTQLYAELQAAGASIYILRFETSDRRQYRRLMAPGDFSERIDHIRWLAKRGWAVHSGFLTGLPGQQPTEWMGNFSLANVLSLQGCSASPFLPRASTPLAEAEPGSMDLALNSVAALRLMRPEWIIPASNSVCAADPAESLRRAWRAGANVASIRLYPEENPSNAETREALILKSLAAEGLTPSVQSLADFGQESPGVAPASEEKEPCHYPTASASESLAV